MTGLFIPDGSTWINVLSDTAFDRTKTKSPNVTNCRVGSFHEVARGSETPQRARTATSWQIAVIGFSPKPTAS